MVGRWNPAQFLTGKQQRFTVPVVNVRGSGRQVGRWAVDGQFALTSSALRFIARGVVDLANRRFRGVRLGADLLKPSALFPNMSGKNVRLAATLDGPFDSAAYSYRLLSDFVQFDEQGFTGLHAEGAGRLTPWQMRVPIRLSASAITGIGDVGGAMLAKPQLEGWLTVTPKLVQAQDLKLSSAKWNGKVSLLIDLVTGRFDIQLSGAMQRYLIPGLGMVDVMTDLHVVPGPGGHGSNVVGTAKAWVRRLDNSFFASLTGGLPWLTTDLQRGSDGIGALLQSPALFAELKAVGRGRAVCGGHVSHHSHRATGAIRILEDGSRRGD